MLPSFGGLTQSFTASVLPLLSSLGTAYDTFRNGRGAHLFGSCLLMQEQYASSQPDSQNKARMSSQREPDPCLRSPWVLFFGWIETNSKPNSQKQEAEKKVAVY